MDTRFRAASWSRCPGSASPREAIQPRRLSSPGIQLLLAQASRKCAATRNWLPLRTMSTSAGSIVGTGELHRQTRAVSQISSPALRFCILPAALIADPEIADADTAHFTNLRQSQRPPQQARRGAAMIEEQQR